MEVVFHDHIGVDREAILVDEEFQGVDENLGDLWIAEEGQPIDRSRGDEVGDKVVFHETVVGSGHGLTSAGA